ncbi:MAG: extracellular solute-binding protein [Candidatus Bipolaricaulota bacterium]|nr:extracellular solute-binding protein [Candidatus Bipolaricaulota bacterium]
MNEYRSMINRESPSPIYQQLKEIIKRKVEDGEFMPGERIPTEYELCDMFAVSRAPVRQALRDLVNEGLLNRQQGSGTFVNRKLGETATQLRVIVPEDLWIAPLRQAVKQCNDEQEGRKISLSVQAVGRPQLHKEILSAVGRGEAPDIALIDWAWEREFADLHFLKRLDVIDPEWASMFKADLFPAFADRTSPVLYGAQPEANVSVLWYRKDWFEKEGQEPPCTWADLVRVTRYFQRRVEFPLTFAAGRKARETTTYQMLPFLWSAGGRLFDGEVEFDGGVVTALQFIVDLVHKYHVASPNVASYEWDQPARLFATGKAALAVGGSYEKPLIQEESGWSEETFRNRVGCIPIPAAADGVPAAVAGGMVYVIFRQTRVAPLALAVLKRIVGPESMRRFCVETGRSPTRVSVARTLDLEEGWFSRRVSELMHGARPRWDIPEYARVSGQIQLMIENAITRRGTPEEAVEKTRDVLRAIFSQS